jgi:AraC-like DNA-binding protein
VIGWNTFREGAQDIIFSTAPSKLSYGTRIAFQNGTFTDSHKHDCIELAYVVHGRLIQNISGRKVVFREREICLIDRDSVHTDLLLHENATVLFLGIDTEYFDWFFYSGKEESDIALYIKKLIARKREMYEFIRFLPKDGGADTYHAFEMLLEEMLDSRPFRTEIVKDYVKRIVCLLPEEYRFELTRKEQTDLNKVLFSDIETAIDLNTATISVKHIAAQFGYNPDYLSRLCFRQNGMSLSRLIIAVRIKKAHVLLETTELPVEQIAEMVGYHNLGFFYKKFKETYHKTPRQIRNGKP